MRFVVGFQALAFVNAYTSYNSETAPGNWNFGNGPNAVFSAQEVKNLPDINVKYHYPATNMAAFASLVGQTSFLKKGEGEIMESLSAVKAGSASVGNYDGAFEMLLGMSHSPRPTAHASAAAVASCRRNYALNTFTGSTSRCGSGDFDLSGLDTAGKLRFAEQCGAEFPCATGSVSYSGCPAGFVKNGSTCSPSAAYTGPCGAQDFSQFNAAMSAAWEKACGAYFA